MRRTVLVTVTGMFLGVSGAWADTGHPDASKAHQSIVAEEPPTICMLIEDAAEKRNLPIGFLTRLIWKESRFRPEAVSPKGAQGIAQFMPATARLRGLVDPFDPAEAIPASAHYLQDLESRFGNLGLAAAAYNAGEGRVGRWLSGSARLPWETRDYVLTITGLTAEEWRLDDQPDVTVSTNEEDCVALADGLSKSDAGMRLVRTYEEADWAPWGIQVAGGFSLSRAMTAFGRIQARHADVLGDRPPMIVRDVNRSRGRATFHTVRVPTQTREEAVSICQSLKRAGGACVVLKSRR